MPQVEFKYTNMMYPTTMQKIINYDDSTGLFEITLKIPKTMSGTYMYNPEVSWEVDAVCVWVDNSREDYSLNHTQYLDYKDSLQATAPIFHFDSQKEAEVFAKKYGLMVEYSRSHHNFTNN